MNQKKIIQTICFVAGFLLVSSDGKYFPAVNFFGAAVILASVIWLSAGEN